MSNATKVINELDLKSIDTVSVSMQAESLAFNIDDYIADEKWEMIKEKVKKLSKEIAEIHEAREKVNSVLWALANIT